MGQPKSEPGHTEVLKKKKLVKFCRVLLTVEAQSILVRNSLRGDDVEEIRKEILCEDSAVVQEKLKACWFPCIDVRVSPILLLCLSLDIRINM